MKIIHHIESFRFGGIEQLVHDLIAAQLQDSANEVQLLVSKNEGEFRERFEKLGCTITALHLKSGMDLRPANYRLAKKTFQSADVIHLHGFNLLVVWAALASRKKIVYTEHGNFGFGREKTVADRINFLLRKLFFKWTKVQICCNSDFTKSYTEQHFYKGKRLQTVHNGVPLESKIDTEITANLRSQYADKWIIGTTSRLVGFKRIDRLISAFQAFHATHPDSELWIVGEGPERPKLEKLVQHNQLEKSVVFMGYQNEISSYQSCMDICVFPSENEPFGLVAVACLALGKPVLVFEDGGGICDIIKRQEVKDCCDDESALLKRLEYYYKNRGKFEPKTELLSYFSVQRMLDSYYKIYQGN